MAQWLAKNTLSKPAHDLLETAIAGTYASAASEVSMLFVLYQMASGGGPSFVLGVKDAAEADTSTGPALRVRPSCAGGSTEPSAPANERRAEVMQRERVTVA